MQKNKNQPSFISELHNYVMFRISNYIIIRYLSILYYYIYYNKKLINTKSSFPPWNFLKYQSNVAFIIFINMIGNYGYNFLIIKYIFKYYNKK